MVTLLFGAFGLIPAVRHSRMARERGYPTRGYWWTFWLTLIIPAALLAIALVVLMAAVQHLSDTTASGWPGQQGVQSSSSGPDTGQTSAPVTGLQGTALAEGRIASDAVGDAASHDGEPGADLTGFSWSTTGDGSDMLFTVSFANFSQSQDATIYLGTGSDGNGVSCPDMPGAQFRIDISGGEATVYSEAGAGKCQDANQIDSLTATQTSTGWTVMVPVSDLGVSSNSQFLVRVLGYTQLDPDTTTIQDELPDSGTTPLLITYP